MSSSAQETPLQQRILNSQYSWLHLRYLYKLFISDANTYYKLRYAVDYLVALTPVAFANIDAELNRSVDNYLDADIYTKFDRF